MLPCPALASPSSSSRPPLRIGRGGLPALAFFLLASFAASAPALPASPRTLPHPGQSANAANPNCPLWEVGWWFVGDINVPDGTHFPPGTLFQKGWWLQNCGRQDWTQAQAVRVSGTFGPEAIELQKAKSGEVFEVWAWMTAPSVPGHYRATYEVHANGFVLDSSFWVDIVVDSGSTFFTLSVSVSGSGSVASSPPGISCGSQCSAGFTAGTTVTLTASPESGSHFQGWSGDPDCSDGVVRMDGDRSCHASFAPDTGDSFTLSVSRTGSGSGAVSGPGIDCGSDCSEVFPSGTSVTLSATPAFGSRFDGWSGDCSSGGTVVMNHDRHCIASFGQITAGPGLELTAWPSEVTLNGQGWPANNPVMVSVTASCPGPCHGDLVLNVGRSDDLAGRFYLYGTSPIPGCTLTDDDPGDRFSARAAILHCSLDLPVGGSASYQLELWMQPSVGGVMPVQATWQNLQRAAPVSVPAAQIHPLVFVHGILGSMPPWNQLVDSRAGARSIFDPFLGHYWPILDTLLKMGYEWNRSLFGIAYDWRAPNERSAEFLGSELAGDVVPRSRPWNVPYVSADARADLLVHSMGGLVARSYIQGPGWGDNVRKVIFVASPHKGFPFDYRTWEGMEWSDYVYDAPLPAPLPPGAGGITFTAIMDRLLWPTLVAKRYRPSFLDTLTCVDLGAVVVPPLLTGDAVLVVGHPIPTVHACPADLVEGWAKSGDPSRGIGSLRQMLPTEDSPPYLYSYFDGSAYPQGHEVNTFLENLNANVGLLVSRIGVGNLYVLAGRGAPETDRRYRVLPHLLGNLWRYGSVPSVLGVSSSVEEWTEGDDLIPTKSATLDYSGLVGLPPGNEQILDAAPDPGGARHSPLMHHDQVQRKWVPTFLADLELPFKTDYVVPDLIPSQGLEVLVVSIACPANLMITDPDGHRLGYDPVTGTVVNEIPSSTYLAPGAEPQLLWIGNPKTGPYEVRITGWPDVGADPSYLVRADRVGVGGTVGPIIAVAGATSPGQEDTFTFDLVENHVPTAEAGPDQTVAVGEDCAARVTLDGSGSSDPDGDALHYTWESGFETVQGVRPTLTLPLGVHTIRLSVDDGKGQVSRDSVVVTVEDETPPTITVRGHLTAEQTSLAGTPVRLPEPVAHDNCSLPSVTNDAPATFPLGRTVVTWTAVDAAGNVGTATTRVVVHDTTPPALANVPGPVTVEQQSRAGTPVALDLPTATDICDAAPVVTSNAPAIFPLGRTTVTFRAVDASGNVATARTKVTVVDTKPPVMRKLVAKPPSLSPPTHKMVHVKVTPVVIDVCDARPRCRIISVTSSDPAGGCDHTARDWRVTGDLTVDLRAELGRGGRDRTYTITVACRDDSGNSSKKTVEVRVRHHDGDDDDDDDDDHGGHDHRRDNRAGKGVGKK
jgi:hypothetical protein